MSADTSSPLPLRRRTRLLEALARPGAYGGRHAAGADDIAIVVPVKGVSLRVMTCTNGEIAALADAGLVRPEPATGAVAMRLVITPQGRRIAGAREGEVDFARPHRDLVSPDVPGETPRALVNANESPLAWLRRRRGKNGEPLLTGAQFEAGERLRRDLTIAQTMPRVTANWQAGAGGAQGAAREHISDTILAARQRVDAALSAAGSEFAGLLVDVCGFLKGLELIEVERLWPPRAARVVLTMALDRLADHYGLRTVAVGQPARRNLHWGAADYRPSIEAVVPG